MEMPEDSFHTDAIPADVLDTMERIHEAGHGVWVVGGALRSFFIGEKPKDWDLATDAKPELITALFSRVVPIGIRHGTVQVLTSERAIEVTTVPERGEAGILADLGRRDFTVNAMAWAFPRGSLLDPHGGLRDLERRLLREVGGRGDRFREDPLRTLRAGRFMSTHRFHIEEETFLSLRRESRGIRNVAVERVRDEWVLLLLGEDVQRGVDCMLRGGVLPETMPEILKGTRGDNLQDDPESCLLHAVRTVHHCPPRMRLRLAAFLHGLATRNVLNAQYAQAHCAADPQRSAALADELLMRWRVSGRDRREVVALIEYQLPHDAETWTDADLRRAMARVGRNLLEDWVQLALADRRALTGASSELPRDGLDLQCRIMELASAGFPMTLRELAVDGSDVRRALDIQPGAFVGRVLRELYDLVLQDPSLNQRKFLMDFLTKAYHK